VGESGTSGALGATLNAIADAVRHLGVEDLDMPVTPDKLWRALREARYKAAQPTSFAPNRASPV
jgi:carbon-monoxide dehydrogenase large subunit